MPSKVCPQWPTFSSQASPSPPNKSLIYESISGWIHWLGQAPWVLLWQTSYPFFVVFSRSYILESSSLIQPEIQSHSSFTVCSLVSIWNTLYTFSISSHKIHYKLRSYKIAAFAIHKTNTEMQLVWVWTCVSATIYSWRTQWLRM
jgi:hypothetical protein